MITQIQARPDVRMWVETNPVPANALLAEDGTPLLAEDGSYLLAE